MALDRPTSRPLIAGGGPGSAGSYFFTRDNHAVLLTPGEGAPPVPTVSIGDVSVSEGTIGTRLATFVVTVSPMSSSPVTVAYRRGGGTIRDDDR